MQVHPHGLERSHDIHSPVIVTAIVTPWLSRMLLYSRYPAELLFYTRTQWEDKGSELDWWRCLSLSSFFFFFPNSFDSSSLCSSKCKLKQNDANWMFGDGWIWEGLEKRWQIWSNTYAYIKDLIKNTSKSPASSTKITKYQHPIPPSTYFTSFDVRNKQAFNIKICHGLIKLFKHLFKFWNLLEPFAQKREQRKWTTTIKICAFPRHSAEPQAGNPAALREGRAE